MKQMTGKGRGKGRLGFVHGSESADIKETFQMARERGLIDSLIGSSDGVASAVEKKSGE